MEEYEDVHAYLEKVNMPKVWRKTANETGEESATKIKIECGKLQTL